MKFNFNDLDGLINAFNEILKEVEAPKEEVKKEEFNNETSNTELEEVGEDPLKDSYLENAQLCNCVFAFDDNNFELNHHVGEYLVDSNTYLEFEHEENGVIVPGITEKQLLRVLLHRNRDNKERSELIEKLLNE